MESIHDVKEGLSARSRTATLDELRDCGRQQVRVIRAEHIAEMISQAVQRTVDEAGLLPQEEVDALVERSREEFKSVVQERQEQASEMDELRARLEACRTECDEFRATCETLQADAGGSETLQTENEELRDTLGTLQTRIEELESELSGAQTATPEPAAGGGGASEAMVMRLMEEVMNLKSQQGQGAAPGAGGDDSIQDALSQITGALNDRLDKFGRKMGISSAVEANDVKFDSLFDDETADIESNIDDVKVKKKKGGGIGANLERLKKLKGGE